MLSENSFTQHLMLSENPGETALKVNAELGPTMLNIKTNNKFTPKST